MTSDPAHFNICDRGMCLMSIGASRSKKKLNDSYFIAVLEKSTIELHYIHEAFSKADISRTAFQVELKFGVDVYRAKLYTLK
jgi:hypothetical protein